MATEKPPIVEISDAAYFNDVLQLPLDKTESHAEDELVARARELGISTALFSAATAQHKADQKRYTSSAESASTVPTSSGHGRTFSTASDGSSASTALTVHSSVHNAATPQPSSPDAKRRELNFAPYDRFVSQQAGKNLDQPRVLRKSSFAVPDSSSKSLFSVSTRRSLASVTSNFKNRLRFRRKSILPPPPNVM